MLASGIGRDDFVGLQLLNGSEYLETMLACFKIRAVPVNVNYRYTDTELRTSTPTPDWWGWSTIGGSPRRSARRSTPGRTTSGARGRRRHRRRPVALGRRLRGDAVDRSSASRGFGPRSADDLYCVYTGGTTGRPKGVLWRHEDIFFAAMGGGDPLHLGDTIDRPEQLAGRVLRPGIVALSVPPFMHASAHWLAFSTFFGGGTLVVLPGGRFDPDTTWRLVADERVAVLVVVGDAMARPLLDALESARDAARAARRLVADGGGLGRGDAGALDQGPTGPAVARSDRGRCVRVLRDRTARRLTTAG